MRSNNDMIKLNASLFIFYFRYRIDDVDYIDESGVIEDKEMNGKDADLSDDEN